MILTLLPLIKRTHYHSDMDEIVGKGITCDRCGDLIAEDNNILLGYVLFEVIDDPTTQHYLCAMCDEIWRSYYLMVGWYVKQEILIIEPN